VPAPRFSSVATGTDEEVHFGNISWCGFVVASGLWFIAVEATVGQLLPRFAARTFSSPASLVAIRTTPLRMPRCH